MPVTARAIHPAVVSAADDDGAANPPAVESLPSPPPQAGPASARARTSIACRVRIDRLPPPLGRGVYGDDSRRAGSHAASPPSLGKGQVEQRGALDPVGRHFSPFSCPTPGARSGVAQHGLLAFPAAVEPSTSTARPQP